MPISMEKYFTLKQLIKFSGSNCDALN